MKYEFYKCIEKQYFEDGKIIETENDNYGRIFDYEEIKSHADYIYRNCLKTNCPISFYWQLLNGGSPLIAQVLNDILQNHRDETLYKISDLIMSCLNVDCHLSGRTILESVLSLNKLKTPPDYLVSHPFLLWEYIAEEERKLIDANIPSRMRSYFLFTNKDDAKKYIDDLCNPNMQIVGAKLLETKNIKAFDMDIWNESYINNTFDKVRDQYKRYWLSDKRERKQTEVLFQGKLQLFSI